MNKILDSFDINEQKQKLTLGISRDVIRRAKAAGINISAITEELLTAITYEPNDGTRRDDVIRAYEALFSAAESIMIPYDDFAVEIGFQRVCNKIKNNITWKEYRIMLTTQGLYRITDSPNDLEDVTVDKVLRWLYEPKKILQNLILSLIDAAEENKEKIKELEFALRLIKALSDEDGNRVEINRERQDSPGRRFETLQPSESENP
jgi:hypothetical protein